MTNGDAVEFPDCLRTLIGFSADREKELLKTLLARRWDQGCLICDSDELRPPGLDPHTIAAFLAEIAGRAAIHPERDATEPFDQEPLPQLVPDQETSGLLVVSQRCDIVKGLRQEPLVEVAHAHRSTDAELLAAVRCGGSACYLHLADCGEGKEGWVVDLRTRGHMPKHWLNGKAPAQLLEPGRPRRRFAARLGERSSRIPIPTSIVDGVQSKLRGWLYSSATRRKQCAHFSDFLLLEAIDGAWGVIALLGEGKEIDGATRDFDALLDAIVERVGPFPISVESSDVLRPEDLPYAEYLDSYRLDFARVTYGSKSDASAQSEPSLGQGQARYTF